MKRTTGPQKTLKEIRLMNQITFTVRSIVDLIFHIAHFYKNHQKHQLLKLRGMRVWILRAVWSAFHFKGASYFYVYLILFLQILNVFFKIHWQFSRLLDICQWQLWGKSRVCSYCAYIFIFLQSWLCLCGDSVIVIIFIIFCVLNLGSNTLRLIVRGWVCMLSIWINVYTL